MLEEFTMEKKLNRSVQSSKGIVDTKKNPDVPVGKPFAKSIRKRDAIPPQKYDSSKKSVAASGSSVQKNKSYGKRTTTRGYHHENGGKDAELVSELDEDFDLKKCKKRNLTYLLNFHCKPREGGFQPYRSTPKSIIHGTIRSLMSTQKHKYNKEQFLQANCQFVVRADEDYSVYMADPDILVDWNLIEQIRVLSPELASCPICLSFPTAAKITRCGHIYCWPCALHYLALTDKSWQKCPICFEAVHRKDLKSVKLLDQAQYHTGSEITFQLVKREKGSTLTIPISEVTKRTPNTLLSVSENNYTTVYSKLLLADSENILQIIEDEEKELQIEAVNSKESPELCFVEEALQLLEERKKKFFNDINEKSNENACCSSSSSSALENEKMEDASSLLSSFTEALPFPEFVDEDVMEDVIAHYEQAAAASFSSSPPDYRIRYESMSSSGEETCAVTAEDLEITSNPNNAVQTKDYYFYQAMDGQQIFLHSINARILERQYGSLENAPPFIKGQILEIETGSMTEELRKRLRYLQHLPLTCQFQVVEIDLQPPIVSAETKEFFKDQLEKRGRQRQKRAKEEKQMEKKAERFARNPYGSHSPPRRLRLDSYHHFPECGSDTPPNLSPRTQSPASSRASSPKSTDTRRSVSPSLNLNQLSINNNTFAQKLKDSKKDGGWQKRAATVTESENGSHSRNLISDAVEAALIKARQEKEANKQSSGKNKKKKKQKPVPLCSVGMVYTSH